MCSFTVSCAIMTHDYLLICWYQINFVCVADANKLLAIEMHGIDIVLVAMRAHMHNIGIQKAAVAIFRMMAITGTALS